MNQRYLIILLSWPFASGCAVLDDPEFWQYADVFLTTLADPNALAGVYPVAAASGSAEMSDSEYPAPTYSEVDDVSASASVSVAGKELAGATSPLARSNTLDGTAACSGYTVENYKQRFQQYSAGPDAQLHALCAGALNYYSMYLDSIERGNDRDESDRIYTAFDQSARVTLQFYHSAR